jgi:hypothetical protein
MNLKYIREYIKLNYSGDDPFWKIDDYIYSFLKDGEITKTEYVSLIDWAEEWYKAQ